MPASLVEARDIRKRFGATEVLRGVDFSVQVGEVHALLGGNGAGKSTLIKIITGVLPRDGGELLIDGRPRAIAEAQPVAAHLVAVVHQEMALLPHLTVAENIALPQRRHALAWIAAAASRDKALQALTLIDADFAQQALERPVSQLSLHERQLVEIARTLASGARLLLLDEPTANLTAAESQRLFDVLRRLVSRQSIGVVFVSHRMREIREIADVCSILRNGTTVVDRARLVRLSDAEIVERMGQGDAVRSLHRRSSAALSARDAQAALRLAHAELNLEIAPGSIVGLAGAPAGPSQLIDQLVGAPGRAAHWRVTRGAVELDTRDPQRALACGVGYVSGDRANKGVLHALPIVDNLMASRRVLERRFWVARSEVPDSQALIDGLAVQGTAWQLPATLSGGTQQKLLVARWTRLKPAVLVLEEPTRGVDIGTKREIYAQIRELASRGTTVIWWSTEAVELVEVCDCVLAFDPDGRPTRVLQRDDISEERLADATGMAA
ncbi:MAG TPA: sugar ABC transporter ATP-binding protein [Burkholderiaceae bacterium]